MAREQVHNAGAPNRDPILQWDLLLQLVQASMENYLCHHNNSIGNDLPFLQRFPRAPRGPIVLATHRVLSYRDAHLSSQSAKAVSQMDRLENAQLCVFGGVVGCCGWLHSRTHCCC